MISTRQSTPDALLLAAPGRGWRGTPALVLAHACCTHVHASPTLPETAAQETSARTRSVQEAFLPAPLAYPAARRHAVVARAAQAGMSAQNAAPARDEAAAALPTAVLSTVALSTAGVPPPRGAPV